MATRDVVDGCRYSKLPLSVQRQDNYQRNWGADEHGRSGPSSGSPELRSRRFMEARANRRWQRKTTVTTTILLPMAGGGGATALRI